MPASQSWWQVATRYVGSFVAAAPSLRVGGGTMRVPGGAPAEGAWEALAGARVSQPAAFVRALLTRDEGRLAFFFGALAPLTERQVAFALRLDAPHTGDRIEAAQRLHLVFARLVLGSDLENRTFWRPAVDPALLASDLRLDASGAPVLPGTQEFWKVVFAATAPRESAVDPAILEGEPVQFGWLCDQVFGTDANLALRRYRAVLFASRLGPALTPANVHDGVDAIRAALDYPALSTVLERGRVHDPAVFAQAARRAAQLSSIDNDSRAARAITQYQGALAIVARAASRRSITPERLAELVSSLSAIEPAEDGDYEGALVRWLEAHIVHTAGAWEADLLRLVAGPAPPEPRIVAWEGTRYRADPAYGETVPHITPARRGCTPLRLVGSRTRRAGRHAEGGGVACRRDPPQCRACVSRGSGRRVGGAWRLDRRCGGALRHRLPGARSGGTCGQTPAAFDGSAVRCSRSRTIFSRAACSS